MTESEFQTQILTHSPKIEEAIAKPGGASVKNYLSALAKATTGFPDLGDAFASLTTHPAKLAALEAQVAATVSAANSTRVTDDPPATLPPSKPAVKAETPVAEPAAPAAGPVVPAEGGVPAPAPVAAPVTVPRPSEEPLPGAPAIVASAPAAQVQVVAPESPFPAIVPPRGYMWVAPAISGLIVVGFFTMLTVLLRHQGDAAPANQGLQNVMFTLLGSLGAAFTQVVNFWLGSSKGSSDKTDLIAASGPVQVQNQQQPSSTDHGRDS